MNVRFDNFDDWNQSAHAVFSGSEYHRYREDGAFIVEAPDGEIVAAGSFDDPINHDGPFEGWIAMGDVDEIA